MVHCVPNEVQQRLAQPVENRAIGFDLAARDDKLHVFARRGCKVAQRAGQRFTGVGKGSYPKLADLLQHVVRDRVQGSGLPNPRGRKSLGLADQPTEALLHSGQRLHCARRRTRALESQPYSASLAAPLRGGSAGQPLQLLELRRPDRHLPSRHEELPR